MAIPALVFTGANNKSDVWVATITPTSVKLWQQDNSMNHLILSRDDLLQILAVLNGAAKLADGKQSGR